MKSARRRVWQVINAQRSLKRVSPRVEVPFACLEINLQAKWTGRWRGYSLARKAPTGPAPGGRSGCLSLGWKSEQPNVFLRSSSAGLELFSGRKLQQRSDATPLFFPKFSH